MIILAIALTVVVALTILILIDPPQSAVHGAVNMRTSEVRSIIDSADRSPFHRRRAEKAVYQITLSGRNAWSDGRLEAALEFYEAARTMAPDDVEIVKSIGMIKYRQQDYASAAAAYAECAVLQPSSVESYTNLSMALIRADRAEEAESIVRRGLEVVARNDHGPLYFLLALTFEAQQRDDEAAQYLGKAKTELGPEKFAEVQGLWMPVKQTDEAAKPEEPDAEKSVPPAPMP
jgi:tetratricopeptide (TPR) repeat protein